jgi:CRP-like cAMP-binding protein
MRGMLGTQGAVASRLTGLATLSATDSELILQLCARNRTVKRQTELLFEGETDCGVLFLHEGWGARYRLLADGRRQIFLFLVPGDIVGLGRLLLETSAFNFVTITEAKLSHAPRELVLEVIRRKHGLASALLRSLGQEQAILAEHLVSLGRRGALQRTAHLLLELRERLRAVGLGSDTCFDCPLTQYDLADALGLTAIHVNRVIRQLREQGLASIEHRQVSIHDASALASIAEFDGRFLSRN